MDLFLQIMRGSIVLGICAAIHLGLILSSLPVLTRVAQRSPTRFRIRRAGLLIGLAFALTVIGHTLQVWTWALAFLSYGALEGLDNAVYFALSSYTTLGYGDIVLADNMRIFGAFASISGMLTFGVSTAYLVGMIGRVMPQGLH